MCLLTQAIGEAGCHAVVADGAKSTTVTSPANATYSSMPTEAPTQQGDRQRPQGGTLIGSFPINPFSLFWSIPNFGHSLSLSL